MKRISISDGVNEFVWFNNSEGTILRNFEGFDYASVRSIIEDIPGREGALFIESKFGRRRLAWLGDLLGTVGDTVFEQRRNQLNAMTQGSLKLLKFITYDDLELQTEVNIIAVKSPYNKSVHTFLIEAIAPDFRLYSQVLQTETTPPTTSSGGSPIPTPIPMSFGVVTGIPRPVLAVGGNVATPPVFVINGPGTNFVVQNITTGQLFNLNLTLAAGEAVTIDVVKRTVIKGSNQNVYGSFDGDFWFMTPGNNEVHFDAASGTGANTLLTIRWRDAYLGI